MPPYIRRQKPSDKADDLRTAIRLSAFNLQNRKGWGMVQHGFRGPVLAVAGSKRELLESPLSG